VRADLRIKNKAAAARSAAKIEDKEPLVLTHPHPRVLVWGFECNRDFSRVTERQLNLSARCGSYFLPNANLPRLAGWTVITSGPLVAPAMMGLLGMVS
jgi:hypothetical protein